VSGFLSAVLFYAEKEKIVTKRKTGTVSRAGKNMFYFAKAATSSM
jgi:hypothetical protein